ncbi:YciI family protein [Rhodoligotrophos defluvii]|uniref:YciI family protein n=1 Tax=Rhodoligotrophos defluvii TaxID=2561934 RepID=UPI0010C93BDF|nr:YciI family protein [Rhodoligotrophos defluvii]
MDQVPNIFICVSEYLRPLEEVDQHLPAHIEWIEEMERRGLMIAGGRRVPPVGGVHILAGSSKQEIRDLLATDPFEVNGMAAYWVFEFALPPGDGKSRLMQYYLSEAFGRPKG